MELVLPNVKYKESYLEALKEPEAEKSDTRLGKPEENESFEDFVQRYYDQMKGLNLKEGYVPATMFWLIDNGQFVGRVQIRHEVSTEHLLKYGGHIGYYIRQSKRKMGYGRKILELALQEAKKMDFEKVLLTCDDNNIGSQKIIEANGGVLENIIEGEKEDNPKKRRYWIKIKK
jgi:predicted acetyltransferase